MEHLKKIMLRSHHHIINLTPAYQGDNQMKAPRDIREHNDQLLEHEKCLCSHPHPGNKSKVVYEYSHSNAASLIGDFINTTDKHQ